MRTKPDTVLVVAAHPDDEVIGAGGTIAAHAAAGDAVFVAILTEGASVQFPGDPQYIDLKREQSLKVAARLGVKDVFGGNFPDQKLDTLPLLEINRFVEGVVARVKPAIIYTHHFSELNRDHRIAHEAAAVASRPYSLPSFKRLLCFSVDGLAHQGAPAARYNFFSDITETLELKIEAMRIYDTEVRQYPHPRSLEALRYAARRNGAVVGLEAAEAFQLILEIRR